MDCDSDDPNANEQACTKVGEKFKKLTGTTLPCEFDPNVCPCYDLWNNGVGAPAISTVTDLTVIDIETETLVSCRNGPLVTGTILNTFRNFPTLSRAACRDATWNIEGDNSGLIPELSSDEFDACKQVLKNAGCPLSE